MRRWIGVLVIGLFLTGCGSNTWSEQNADNGADTELKAESAAPDKPDTESAFADNCQMLDTAINENGVGENDHPSQYDYTQFVKWFDANASELGEVPAKEMPQFKGKSLLNVLYLAAIDKANENKPGMDNSAQTKIQNEQAWDDAINELHRVCDDMGVTLN